MDESTEEVVNEEINEEIIKEESKELPFLRVLIVFVCCYFTNLSILFGKGAFSVSIATMVDEKLMNKEQAGIIFGLGAISYCIGNYFIGIPIDKIGPRFTFIIIIIILIGTLIGLAFVNNVYLVGLLFIIYSFFNSGNWPSMAKLIKNWVTEEEYGRYYGILSTSSQMGRVISLLLLGFLISKGMEFHYNYLISALLLFLLLIIDLIFLRSSPTDIGYIKKKENQQVEKEHVLNHVGYKEALIYFLTSFKVWLSISFYFFSGISMEIFLFLPIFLTESQNINPGIASISTSSFSMGCAISVLIMGFIYDKLSPLLRFLIISFQLSIAILANLIIFYFYKKLNIFITILIIFIIGISYSPAHYIPVGVFVSNYGGKYTGILFTMIEGPGLIGSVIFDIVSGFILERFGWNLFFLLLNMNGIFLLVFTSSFLYVLMKSN